MTSLARVVLPWLCAAPAMAQQAEVQFTPPRPLMDERVAIEVRGLPADAEVAIRATTTTGAVFRAEATYKTTPTGTLDLTRTAPLRGSYAGVDGMGLIWSMTRLEATEGSSPS